MGDDPATRPPAPRAKVDARRPNAEAQAADPIRTIARAFEIDRYLTALLAPRHVRDDLIALAAFAGEIGRIPAFVSEPMVGDIRLQWWRDAIAGMGDPAAVTGHPIADALAQAVERHALPRALLLSAIDAQSDRLLDVPFAATAALLANIDQFDGALFDLAWHILAATPSHQRGERPDPPLPALFSAARAYGLARILVEVPIELATRRTLLPENRLAAHSLAPGNLHLPQSRPDLATVMSELATQARSEMNNARVTLSTAPRALRMAILPAALVRPYLRLSELSDSAPITARDIMPISRVTRLWIAARWGVL